jgi:hypothetical protein
MQRKLLRLGPGIVATVCWYAGQLCRLSHRHHRVLALLRYTVRPLTRDLRVM